ncbi:hypothetical protein [Calothrix sp. NIES-2098]|uniref:hypothetical protein n=1 Tax=Calothrix sp. NIES-2098 TaxID=1954171 RepID=UPI0030DB2F46
MSIRERTIEENRKPSVCMEGSQTLTEAIEAFQALKYSENNTYLVVRLSDDKYNVILFSNLKAILKKLGSNSLTQLSNLPIPPASRVVPTDTEESGGDILDWVASHPQSPVVVTDAGKFAALFVNPNRSGDSGLADNLSLLGLHGELVQLSQDPRSDYKPKVQPPTCPHCHQVNFYRFNTDAKQFFCPNCKGIV